MTLPLRVRARLQPRRTKPPRVDAGGREGVPARPWHGGAGVLGSVAPAALAALVALALAACLLAPAAPATAEPLATGERLSVQGLVTDAEGRPLDGLRVSLVGARSFFSLRHLSRRERDPRRVTTTTDERGEFRLDWVWDPFFNHFELEVAVPLPARSGKPEAHVLDRREVTRRVRRAGDEGGPVALPVVIEDTSWLRSLERFLAAFDSADERRVYDALGLPDDVERIELGRDSQVVWWYFADGRAYRFQDGRLVEVDSFEPVPPLPEDARAAGDSEP